MRLVFIAVFLFISGTLFSKKPKDGVYRAVLILDAEAGTELPFNFELKYTKKKATIIIRNADERIVVDEITIKGDSLNFKMPVFDTEFRTKMVGDNLEGLWINHYKTTNNKIAFKAVFGESKRFLSIPGQANPVFEGNWEVTFSPGLKEESKAVGFFHHQEQTDFVTGTFLTETGDYRYLEGMKAGNKLMLSCFDGSHAFLFTADYSENKIINGRFYSGSSWKENWFAIKNDSFQLRNAEEITIVKDKNARLEFSFPSLTGNPVSLSDKKFENKPVIIQIMGSWCPNCMDESAYLAGIYQRYQKDGLEIIALAFEKTDDLEKAKSQVFRLKKRYAMNYDILITQKTGKDKAQEVLPMLTKISAFPTTLFLNRQHQIVRVHAGFSGPATGREYELFKQNTESLIINLLKN